MDWINSIAVLGKTSRCIVLFIFNALVASASNDRTIKIWKISDPKGSTKFNLKSLQSINEAKDYVTV